MSDETESSGEKPFYVDRAKSGRAACKKCKEKINNGELRLGKLGYNPFGSGTMKLWHHVPCMFEVFKKQRKTTKKIDSFDDIGGWDIISDEDKETIKSYFSPEDLENLKATVAVMQSPAPLPNEKNNDNSFRMFRKICCDLTNASSYLNKTAIVKEFFTNGSSGNGFNGDIQLWCRSLLPMAAKRVYNLQSKQLINLFSEIFGTSQEEMLEDLEKGDIAETIGLFFERSIRKTPIKKACLSLQDVDYFLEYLSKLTREADQKDHFESILPKCTTNDLKIIIRLIKHDLRINAGPKHILEALHSDAYQAFQSSRDLNEVVKNATNVGKVKGEKGMQIGIKLMTPVLPMLAAACGSVDEALKKCPAGMFSEIKYDGERVQLHKQGDTFKYFSRSLKPVVPHKVNHFAEFIPKAFPHGKDLILDSEILMIDTKTGQPLPFGSLGVHKKTAFKDATVCLFVFDCIYYNDKSLINEPISMRRKILLENMTEIKNHVVFSEMKEIHVKDDLEDMMERVFKEGLEGLVLKPLNSIYEPGKRHWLKVKKDYLFGGAMADSADLVVLGAWFGTGKKGGMMSIFLMGCYNEKKNRWETVTKVHGGHDDKTLDALQTELKMLKISRNATKVPSWLHCTKTMIPDFVAEDPKESQVWEITGAEFTRNQVHTADGISIRFPRVTRIRRDKDWKTATNLEELKHIYQASKDTQGFTLKGKGDYSPDKVSRNSDIPKNKVKDDDYEAETDSEKEEAQSPVKKKATVIKISPEHKEQKVKVTHDSPKQVKKRPNKDKLPKQNETPPKKRKIEEDGGSDTEVDDDLLTNTSEKIEMTNPIPNIFEKLVICLHKNVSEIDKLKRYIIAFGGIIYSEDKNTTVENSKHQVTHVIYSEKDIKKKMKIRNKVDDLKHVFVDWLWDSIRNRKRMDECKFLAEE